MPRYIDAEKLIQRLEREVESCKDTSKGSALGFKMAISFAETLSDEQVVPRAVVDALKLEVENEILKRDRLQQILNSYALQYGTVKDQQEVIDKIKCETAKEIFEETRKIVTAIYNKHIFKSDLEDEEKEAVMDFEVDISSAFDELEEKYTEVEK